MQLEDGCVREIKSDIHSIKTILVNRSVNSDHLHILMFVSPSVCPLPFATKTLGDLEEDEEDSGAGESPAGESVGTGEEEDGTEVDDETEADDETEIDGKAAADEKTDAGDETEGTESQDTDENGSWSSLEDQEELLNKDDEEMNKDNKTTMEAEIGMEKKGIEAEKKDEEVEDLKKEEEVEDRKNQERELSFVDGQWIEE